MSEAHWNALASRGITDTEQISERGQPYWGQKVGEREGVRGLLTVISLCDFTGNMVRPWAEAGYECYCLDYRHSVGKVTEKVGSGVIVRTGMDVTRKTTANFLSRKKWAAMFAFPACTNLAVSGARWFKDKGLKSLIEALTLVEACRELCEGSGAPWMLENPIGTLSTYWREPDYTFDPWEFSDYPGGESDTYSKKTCLWTGNGFVMPDRTVIADAPLFGKNLEIDDRIHQMPPSDERGNLRSVTPMGFARAVFQANHNVKGENNGTNYLS